MALRWGSGRAPRVDALAPPPSARAPAHSFPGEAGRGWSCGREVSVPRGASGQTSVPRIQPEPSPRPRQNLGLWVGASPGTPGFEFCSVLY